VGTRNFDDTILQDTGSGPGHRAQLRLRNLGGIIVLDFIDMVNPARELVLPS